MACTMHKSTPAKQTRNPLVLLIARGIVFSILCYFLLLFFDRVLPNPPQPNYTAPSQFHAPHPNLWKELDATEGSELVAFLHQKPNVLNLTKHPRGYGEENYIFMLEVLRPNKSDVLEYFGESGATPPRHARVCVLQDSGTESFLADYVVGPLPPSTATQVQPLTYPYNSGRNKVRVPIANEAGVFAWLLSICEEIADMTEDLLGAKVNPDNLEDPEALLLGTRFALIATGKFVTWLTFYRDSDSSGGISLLNQGLYVKLDISSSDPKTWTASDWYYNGVLYPDLSSFRAAWLSPNFTKAARNLDGPWTDTVDFSSNPRGRSKPPPIPIQPYGPRYDLDRKENYISWMGFTFYVATAEATALSLFDIRFNDTPIIYHLGLQEALSHYAGSDPMQSGLAFLDSFFGMGSGMYSLVPGHDCPAYAEYLDITYYDGEQALTNHNAICIFEFTADHPLQRHTDESVTISRNTYLVLRSVSTMGNYDFTIDYLLYLDGSIEVKVRFSGFIFTAFAGFPKKTAPTPKSILRSAKTRRNEYGYRIHDAATSSLHDHALLFRADLDIAGTRNSLVRTTVTPFTETFPWDSPEIPGPRNTMHLTHTTLRTETALNWTHNSADLYLIQSNLTNAWGEQRAYRIQPGTGTGTPAHLTIPNSTMLGHSATWSGSDLWVLRTHDTEPSGAHPLNYLSPHKPLVNFSQNCNDESILDEDLVLYFTLGGHHVPGSQDIPNTLMHSSASSVLFTPFNFFDHDVSLHSRQGVRVDRSGRREKDRVKYFGGRYEEGLSLGKEDLEPDLDGFLREREEDGDRWRVGKRGGGGLRRLLRGFGWDGRGFDA